MQLEPQMKGMTTVKGHISFSEHKTRTADSCGDLLGALHTQTDVAILVANNHKRLRRKELDVNRDAVADCLICVRRTAMRQSAPLHLCFAHADGWTAKILQGIYPVFCAVCGRADMEHALKRVRCPARVCFWTGMIFMTSSLSAVPKKNSTIWCSLIGIEYRKMSSSFLILPCST